MTTDRVTPPLLSRPADLLASRNHARSSLRLKLAPLWRTRTLRRLGEIPLCRRRGIFLPRIDERLEIGVELVRVLTIHEVPAIGDDDHLHLRVFRRDDIKEPHLAAKLRRF